MEQFKDTNVNKWICAEFVCRVGVGESVDCEWEVPSNKKHEDRKKHKILHGKVKLKHNISTDKII